MNTYKKLRLAFKNKQLAKKLAKENIIFDFKKVSSLDNCVLVIDTIIPEFDKDSGSRRLQSIISLMLKNNFNVVLMADKKEYKYKSDYISKFKEMGVVVYEPCLDSNGDFITRENFIEKIGSTIDFAWLHRPDIFNAYYKMIKKYTKSKLIFDMVDFHYLRLNREWKIRPTAKLKTQVDKYLQIELNNCDEADVIVPISYDDENALKEFYKKEKEFVVIGNIHDYKKDNTNSKSFNERKNLLFIGGFGHPPNVEAVLYLHDNILPLLKKEIPEICIDIIGSYPPDHIKTLDSPNFKIHGFIEDISNMFNSAKVFVAPLAYGAGVKGKIGQSFEFGLPVVTTEIGAEGFDFKPYENKMIAPVTNAEEYVKKILEIYKNEELWNKLSIASENILDPYSSTTVEKAILKVLK